MILTIIFILLFAVSRYVENKTTKGEKIFNKKLDVNYLVISWIGQLVFLSLAIISFLIYII